MMIEQKAHILPQAISKSFYKMEAALFFKAEGFAETSSVEVWLFEYRHFGISQQKQISSSVA